MSRRMAVARPVAGSTSTRAPPRRGSPSATSKELGMNVTVATRTVGRKVRGLADAAILLQSLDDLRFPVDGVAERYQVNAGGADFPVQSVRDARTAGSVLRVGDDEVDALRLAQHRQRPLKE